MKGYKICLTNHTQPILHHWLLMSLGGYTQTQAHAHTHTHTHIPTREQKRFLETRCARPLAMYACFNKLLKQFDKVFRPELGNCKEVKVKLYLKEWAIPEYNWPRTTTIAMKTRIEEELCRQKKLGILKKVDTVEWAAPVVPVMKHLGAIRLRGDYKVSINPHLEVNKYPLLHPGEIFTALNGGKNLQFRFIRSIFCRLP